MIRVYTAPGCGPCTAVKHAMRSRKLMFSEVDATKAEATEYLASLGYRQVPVTVTPEGEHWQGLDSERITALAAMVVL